MVEIGPGKGLRYLVRYFAATVGKFQYAGALLILLMMFVTMYHVLGRYAFSAPLKGITDLGSFMLLMLVFLSFAHVLMVKGHVAVGTIVNRLSERAQLIIESFTYFVGLAISVLAVYCTFHEGAYLAQSGLVRGPLNIPVFPFYYVIGFGWVLFSLAMLVHVVNSVSGVIRR